LHRFGFTDAGLAAYHATLGLAHIGVPSQTWQQVFAIIGAVAVGAAAWARMTLLAEPVGGRGIGADRASLPLASATKDR